MPFTSNSFKNILIRIMIHNLWVIIPVFSLKTTKKDQGRFSSWVFFERLMRT